MREDPKHRAHIRRLPCSGCGRPGPSEAAHVRLSDFGGVTVPESERGGTGLKPADRHCVPLCRECHSRQHNKGERSFWIIRGINPLALAASLHRNTGKVDIGRAIVQRARNGWAL